MPGTKLIQQSTQAGLLAATPIAWYIMDHWLEKHTYHTQISWWIFAAASLGTIAITLVAVS